MTIRFSETALAMIAASSLFGCGKSDEGASSAASTASASAAAASPTTPGFRLETTDEQNETPTGLLPDKLVGEGPAAAFFSDSPLPDGPRKWVSLFVFPKGTDEATICDSDFPGPKGKSEYILGLDLQYDGELKVGPAVSLGSPSIAYLSKEDDGKITSSSVGKPNFVDLRVTAVTADSISVVAKEKPGAPFKLDASFTAKRCK